MMDIQIRIDLDQLTIGDLEALERASTSGKISDLIDVLDRLVVGGARQLPASALPAILRQLNDEIRALANPGD